MSGPCEECGEWVQLTEGPESLFPHECPPEIRIKKLETRFGMREERDHARMMLEKVGQMMGGQ